jgi:hypothetical protein
MSMMQNKTTIQLPKSFTAQATRLGLPDLTFRGATLHFRSAGTPSIPARRARVEVEDWTRCEAGWEATVNGPGGGFVRIFLRESVLKGSIQFELCLENHCEWTIEEVEGPCLSVRAGESLHLLLPDGLGTRTPNPHAMEAVDLSYPSGRCTMAWSAVAGPRGGYYFGRHDPEVSVLRWKAQGAGDQTLWSLVQTPWVRPGGEWHSAPIVLEAYEGVWQNAARIYRAWADEWCGRGKLPTWPNEQSGWFLAILKQQNGAIYWNYHDLSKVWRIALDHGLTAVGLFGWAHGGHDRYYPDYHPDPAMGGEAVLKEALAEARSLGLRTILYANGQLIDTATEFYRWQGNEACALGPNREPYVSSIRKFNSSTPVTFALGCHEAPVWQAQMRKLALAAERLGADGILYDQIGVSTGTPCHNPAHDHATPDSARGEDRVRFYRDLAGEMQTINPEFIISTEGVFDALIPAMGWFHGWGTGFAPKPIYEFIGDGKGDFPSLFRTTFPEVPLIQRFSTPALDAEQANHALLYGLSHEIEARWPADLRYLEQGESPADEAYADCTYYPPDLKLMQRTPAEASRSYVKALCEFATEHADLLRSGKFVGDEGVDECQDLTATARVGAGVAGILVVNNGQAPVTVVPTFRMRRAETAFDPIEGELALDAPLKPRDIRLFRYTLDA